MLYICIFMIVELKIENFGIIEAQRIRPGQGLNIISGETGSGKSLVMNALDIVFGARATPGLVRNGAHRMVIEAVFDLSTYKDKPLLQEHRKASQCLEIRREINIEGRSRVFCNGELTNLSHIRSLSNQLLEMSGQHEHQGILDTDTHLEYLDLFAQTEDLTKQVTEFYQRFSSIRNRLRNVSMEAEQRENRRDFLHFALEEIETFAPKEGEFEQLNHEKALIHNSGKLFQDLCAAYSMIRSEDFAILDRLGSVIHLLEPHCQLIPEAEEHIEQIQEASYLLEAAADFLREQKERLQFSPERLEDVSERLAGYQRLHKKYGGTTSAVIHARDKYLQELGSIEMSSEQMEELELELDALQKQLFAKAEELSRLRRAAIPSLEEKLAEELEHLGMPGAQIEICLKREVNLIQSNQDQAKAVGEAQNNFQDESNQEKLTGEVKLSHILQKNKYSIHEKGLDRVEFLLASNPGEAPRPLRKIASGGELSRISLAFKSIFFDKKPVPTVIFDEIDAGIGGEITHAIGNRLKDLAKQSQVIVVTHLPQIARLGEQHFSVSKKYTQGRVVSQINCLLPDQRLHELARMLGGERPGSVVLEHARELLLAAG